LAAERGCDRARLPRPARVDSRLTYRDKRLTYTCALSFQVRAGRLVTSVDDVGQACDQFVERIVAGHYRRCGSHGTIPTVTPVIVAPDPTHTRLPQLNWRDFHRIQSLLIHPPVRDVATPIT